MNQKELFEKKMRARLDEWSAEIDRLEARAEQADADVRMALKQEIDAAAARRDVVRTKLEEFASAGDDAWEDLKTGMEHAWSSLESAMRAARSRFA